MRQLSLAEERKNFVVFFSLWVTSSLCVVDSRIVSGEGELRQGVRCQSAICLGGF